MSTTETDRPFSQVECSRNGFVVYTSSVGHFEDYYYYFGEPAGLMTEGGISTGSTLGDALGAAFADLLGFLFIERFGGAG